MSENRLSDEIRADLPQAAPSELPPVSPAAPPVVPPRMPPLKRFLRGLAIGAILGAFIGAVQGGALMLVITNMGSSRSVAHVSTEHIIRHVGDAALRFGVLGAVLVGLSQLIFGGRTKPPDRKS
jgi:hypothetical protein